MTEWYKKAPPPGEIPRSRREDVYQPPARLSDFLAFVRSELPEEQAQVVLAAAERFRARGRGR